MCYSESLTVYVVKAEEQCQGGKVTLVEAHLNEAKAEALRDRLDAADAGGYSKYTVEQMDVAR